MQEALRDAAETAQRKKEEKLKTGRKNKSYLEVKKDMDQNVLQVIFQNSRQTRQPAIFEPDDIGKSYLPQKKALNRSR